MRAHVALKLYVTVPAEPGAQRNLGSKPFEGIKPAVHVVSSDAPLINLPDLELGDDPVNRSWTVSDFSLDKRVYYLVQASALLTVPFSNDKIIAQRFDLEAELKRSDIDYFYVASTPSREFVPGKKYSYRIRVASKGSKVKFEMSSGPDGMRVSKSGELTWSVPKDFNDESVDVIVSISNNKEQTTYETFTLYARKQ